MFSWLPSGSGVKVADLLKRKAAEGVEVNVLIDDVGSLQVWKTPRWKFFEDLRAAGVHVIRNAGGVPGSGQAVDHQKLYVIDGATAFVGGMNLSGMYDTWHDTMVKLEGPAVGDAAKRFLERWTSHGGTVSPRQAEQVARANVAAAHGATGASVSLVTNDPHSDVDVTRLYLDRIERAKRRVWIESPVIGSEAFAQALEGAARRGVDVQLFVTGATATHGVPGLSLISRSFYGELMAAGVKVIEQASMSHSKVLLADDQATVGSFNLTNRSSFHDFEIAVDVRDDAFERSLAAMIDADRAAGHVVTPADISGPLARVLINIRKHLHVQY